MTFLTIWLTQPEQRREALPEIQSREGWLLILLELGQVAARQPDACGVEQPAESLRILTGDERVDMAAREFLFSRGRRLPPSAGDLSTGTAS